MLEGQPLTIRVNEETKQEEFLLPDGTLVAPEHHAHIVYVNHDSVESKENWWARCGDQSLSDPLYSEPMQPVTVHDVTFHHDDIANMLIVIGGQAGPDSKHSDVDIDAGFFHRTIGRFIGIWEDSAPESEGVEWDYQFWKAELAETPHENAPDHVPAGQSIRSYEVSVFRGENKPPKRYAYWIATTSQGKIIDSAWLSEPPNLLGQKDGHFSPEASKKLSANDLSAMFQDADESE